MDLRHTLRLQPLLFPSKEIFAKYSPSFGGSIPFLRKKQGNSIVSYSRMDCLGMSSPHFHKSPLLAGNFGRNKEETCRCAKEDEPLFMDEEEREEWRRKIREVIDTHPDVDEEVDPIEKRRKMQKLLADYPLVMEEEDPDWPEEDADGQGFGLDQFFNKITIKNAKKDNDDDENDDNEIELVWQDDDYIRPIKDITSAAWEETVFKDISPLIVLVHNRYKRPKENEKIREELEKSIHIIWNCRLPSPRCVAIDAVVDVDLVSALQVSVYPQLIFTKSGKILYREKGIRTADELSKIMAFFYFGAAKPPYLNTDGNNEEPIPTIQISHLQ